MNLSTFGLFLILLTAVSCKKGDDGKDARDVFIRTWTTTSCKTAGYPVNITRQEGTDDKIIIHNLLNEGTDLVAIVIDNDSYQIPVQVYHNNDTTISGSGSVMNSQNIFATYKTVVATGSFDRCDGTGF